MDFASSVTVHVFISLICIIVDSNASAPTAKDLIM